MEEQWIVEIINSAMKVVWNYRKQFFCKGAIALRETISLLQSHANQLIEFGGEEIFLTMGFSMLLDAQEREDEILVADVLEGQTIPALEQLVQNLQMNHSPEEKSVLEKNLSSLKSRGQEVLVQKIEAACPRNGCEYIAEYTASGHPTICLMENGSSYYISGNNNPYRDALSFVMANTDGNYYEYTLLGAGLFFEAQVLLELRPDVKLTVVEEDLYLLKLALSLRDLTELFADERFFLLAQSYTELVRNLDAEKEDILIRKPSLRHIAAIKEREVLQTFFVKKMTILEQAFVLETEFRKNILPDNQVKSVDELTSCFEGKKVYFVAGGPSLDGCIEYLRNREKDSVLICVGTSAARLKSENITPDFVIVIDVGENIYRQINGNLNENLTSLIYMCSANAKAVASFQGKKYAAFQKGFELAESYAGKNGYSLISTGGSVSTTALDICIRFGAKEVICMGLDLAYTNNKSHAKGTISYSEMVSGSTTPMVKSVAGDMIPTANNLHAYHRWIENRIRDEKNTKFINVSNGAYIKGMENISVEEAD